MRTLRAIWALCFTCLAVAAGGAATLVSGLPVPQGYERLSFTSGSYSAWLQKLPLKSGVAIKRYDSSLVPAYVYGVLAVVDMPLLFTSNVEQCADYCMRFWAEYHKAAGKLDQLYLFDYSGKKRYYKKSGQTFRQFFFMAASYSNSHSLKKGCLDIGGQPPVPGDMIVQNDTGGIGHVSLIVDACRNAADERLYLIGFSFMPAQEFHIERAPSGYGKGGWFSREGYLAFLAEYYNFGTPVFRRFE